MWTVSSSGMKTNGRSRARAGRSSISIRPDMREVVFMGAIDPHTPVAQGWLRASHRKLDPKLSTEYRPYHTHDELQPLKPGEVVPLEVELWPSSVVVPAGHRVALSVRGKDY